MRHLTMRIAAPFTGLVVVFLLLGGCILSSTPIDPPTVATSAQQQYIDDINASRKALHEAPVQVGLRGPVKLDQVFSVDLEICSDPVNPLCMHRLPCLRPPIPEPSEGSVDLCEPKPGNAPPDPLPDSEAKPLVPGEIFGLGLVEIGGRVKVDLVSREKDLQISPVGPGVQTMTKIEDVGAWRWHVFAKRSARFHLRFTVAPLKEDSDAGLGPVVNFDLVIRVYENSGATVRKIAKEVEDWLGKGPGLAALIMTAVGILSYRSTRRDIKKVPTEEKASYGKSDESPSPRPDYPSSSTGRGKTSHQRKRNRRH